MASHHVAKKMKRDDGEVFYIFQIGEQRLKEVGSQSLSLRGPTGSEHVMKGLLLD